METTLVFIMYDKKHNGNYILQFRKNCKSLVKYLLEVNQEEFNKVKAILFPTGYINGVPRVKVKYDGKNSYGNELINPLLIDLGMERKLDVSYLTDSYDMKIVYSSYMTGEALFAEGFGG